MCALAKDADRYSGYKKIKKNFGFKNQENTQNAFRNYVSFESLVSYRTKFFRFQKFQAPARIFIIFFKATPPVRITKTDSIQSLGIEKTYQ